VSGIGSAATDAVIVRLDRTIQYSRAGSERDREVAAYWMPAFAGMTAISVIASEAKQSRLSSWLGNASLRSQ